MLKTRAMADVPEKGVKKGDIYYFYILDAHHHMGKEALHRNSPTNAYEFYNLLWFELKKLASEMMDENDLLFEPVDVVPPPLQDDIFGIEPTWQRWNHGWLVDRTIVFPYTDDYSKNPDSDVPSFRLSNDKIAGWTTRQPHSSRLIGFCRIDPRDAFSKKANLPIDEIRRAVTHLGLRGLKLHPLAQLFLDDIESQVMSVIVQEAHKLGIPVIFDTRNIRTAMKIRGLVEMIRDEINSQSFCPRVILAHAAMSPGRPELYDILSDPCFYVDTSSLHDRDIPLLIETAYETTGGIEGWSERMLFGTDYSFLSIQAAELILYLLSHDFPGRPIDIQNILAGNALRIARRPVLTYRKTAIEKQQMIYDNNSDTNNIALEVAKHLMGLGWDITSIDYLPYSSVEWPFFLGVDEGGYVGVQMENLIISLRMEFSEQELILWIRNLDDDTLAMNIHGKGHFPPLTDLSSSKPDQNPLLREFSEKSNRVDNLSSFLSQLDTLLKL